MIRRVAVLGCFLLSGATALAYEVVWVRQLTLVFGATVLGAGAVMASYMAGLAWGSHAWGRRADQTTRPLRLYARLELGVAVSAALTPLVFHAVMWLHSRLFAGAIGDFSLLSVGRFVLCFPALLVPTFLMGGTLPVLARYYTASPERMGRGAGALYAVNTVGATLGTLLTGFVLIEQLGVKGTLWSAAAVNAAVALVAWRLSRREPELPPAWAHGAPDRDASPQESDHRALRLVMWGFGLSGLAAMVYEVAWTRAFVQVFGNSTYAFTTMLAAFLVGLALGAALAARSVDRGTNRFTAFALLELLIALWAAAATPLIEYLPGLFLTVYERSGAHFAWLQAAQFVACCLLLLPATLALGALFPLVSRLAAHAAGGAGRSAGLPYACNTLGTVVGSLLAGFVLLPRLGIECSLAIGVAIHLAVGLAVLLRSGERVVSRSAALGFVTLGLVALARLVLVGLDPSVMTAGFYMYPEYFLGARAAKVPLSQVLANKKVLFYHEGYGASISVFRLADGSVTLQTNGKTDASTGDLSTQRILSHLPLLLRPRPQNVLVVGLASGCSVGSALLHAVGHVTCVEIEPAMLPAARYFDTWNHRCLDDRRVKLLLADARNFVLMSRAGFDLITAEPTNPWIAGVNNLFTREYYQDCARRLSPGGIMCQWLPAYNLDPAEMRTALATFRGVFPHASLWVFPKLRSDFILIGSRDGVPPDPVAVARELQGAVAEDAAQVGLGSLWTLFGGLVLDEAALTAHCQGAPLNTDERPRLEFSTPRHLHDKDTGAHTVTSVYGAGRGVALPLQPSVATALLTHLGLRLPPGATVREAALLPHHPADLSTGRPQVDQAELRLELQLPSGPARLRVTSGPAKTWPESLAETWLADPPTGQVASGLRGGRPAARLDLPAAGLTLQCEAAGEGVAEEVVRAVAGR